MTTLRAAAAGVSRLSRSASRIVSKAASGFHLLRVEAYTQTKRIPSGQSLYSPVFDIGGCSWYLKYYPNGRDSSTNSDYISLYLGLHGYNKTNNHQLQAQYKLSILDQAGNVAHGPPPKTAVFNRDDDDDRDEEARLRGHERFIRREELERRDDLLKDNCVVFRCDVDVGSFTELNTASLACEDGDDCAAMCDDHDNDEFGLKPREPWEPRGPLRPNDTEFVQWCLAQKRMG